MTVKGGTSQACAACKYQRRKCSSDCALAKYFPADQPKLFQNAHKLFGVSNILKILKTVDPTQKGEAMKSIIAQANIRDKSPVHGCLGFIVHLQNQVQQAEQELEFVNTQLAIFRSQQHHIHQQYHIKTEQIVHHHHHHHHRDNNNNNNISPPSSQLQLGTPMSNPNINNTNINPSLSLFQYQQQQSSFNNNNMATTSSSNGCNNDNNNNTTSVVVGGLWGTNCHNIYEHGLHHSQQQQQQQHLLLASSHDQSHLASHNSQAASGGAPQDQYDEISPFFDTIEDRQSYIDSKEAYDSSSESSLKDSIQSAEHVGENELKSAAACFTLTSVN
ncbi:hypothetical protein H6P81_010344 [Aristolochia fimbriata]|uniref:LOB domain-containing protein n=1 Tax=Aristolochia fimbriata TaxID=158543 RepID=A0AAV7EP46_ARIFI|nr:hypothetical protein H6P81_010344 [Aristolochia fimbriata]